MGVAIISFEASEELIASVDEIASNREVDRAEILREALAQYVADYAELNADIDQARRQIDAGHYTLHEDVVRELKRKHRSRAQREVDSLVGRRAERFEGNSRLDRHRKSTHGFSSMRSHPRCGGSTSRVQLLYASIESAQHTPPIRVQHSIHCLL